MELQPEYIPRGNERILFVDDNESIVDIVQLMLQNLGYKVTGFTDGREALKVFSEKPSEFDLVITDYVMPHLTGGDIAQRAKRCGLRKRNLLPCRPLSRRRAREQAKPPAARPKKLLPWRAFRRRAARRRQGNGSFSIPIRASSRRWLSLCGAGPKRSDSPIKSGRS